MVGLTTIVAYCPVCWTLIPCVILVVAATVVAFPYSKCSHSIDGCSLCLIRAIEASNVLPRSKACSVVKSWAVLNSSFCNSMCLIPAIHCSSTRSLDSLSSRKSHCLQC